MALTLAERQQKNVEYCLQYAKDSRVGRLLREHGFGVSTYEDQIVGVHWESQKEDLRVLANLEEMCEETSELDDQEFAHFITPLSHQLLATPLFQRLHAVPPEKRSQAHQDFTPFEHTVRVVRLLDTSGLSPDQRAKVRFDAWTHDLGKIVIAKGDTYDDHSYITSVLMNEYYIRDKGMNSKDARVRTQVVAYHHILQAIDDGVVTFDELCEDLDQEQILLISVLALADVRSIDKYQEFALANAQHAVEILIQILTEFGQAQEFLQVFVHGLIDFAIEKASQMGEVLGRFIEWFEVTAQKISINTENLALFERLKLIRVRN